MKKRWLLLIVVLFAGFQAQNQSTVFKGLSVSEISTYKKRLSQVRMAVENALSKKKLDTLCLFPLNPDNSQCVDSLIKGVSVRDSIKYVYAGTLTETTTRIDIHYGYCFRKTKNGNFVKRFPVFKFEEYKNINGQFRKISALSVHALTGEYILIAEDYRQSNQRWSEEEMEYYQHTPIRALNYLF